MSTKSTQKKQPWWLFFTKAALVLVPLYLAGHFASQRWSIGIDPQAQVSVLTEDGLHPRLMVIDHADHDYSRGDIVSLRLTDRAKYLIGHSGIHIQGGLNKRVAGMPGDRVKVTSAGVWVNGVQMATGLALAGKLRTAPSEFSRTIVVAPRHYFLLGDVDNSFDSRYWGTAPASDIIGQAHVLYAEIGS